MSDKKAANREWRTANRERLRAYDRARYLLLKEKKQAQRVAREAANPEKYKKRRQELYARSRSQRLENSRSFRRRHPEKSAFCGYRGNARLRGIPFSLTFEQFLAFWQKPCHYTGRAISTIGLDRVDNTKGYTIDNVVPCCSAVNMAKRKMTVLEFVEMCRQVVARHER